MTEATAVQEQETRTEAPADAAVENQGQEEQLFETADAYLESLSTSKESATPAPESRPAPQRPNLLDDPRAAQSANEYRNRHAQRQQVFDRVGQELTNDFGIREADARRLVKELKDTLNSHHADGLSLAGYEAAITAVQYEQRHIQDAIVAALPKPQVAKLGQMMQKAIDTTGQATYKDTISAIVELARDGYVSEKDNKEAVKAAFEAGRKTGEHRATAGENSNRANGRVNPSPRNLSRVPTSLAEARSLHAKGEISNAQMAEYKRTLS